VTALPHDVSASVGTASIRGEAIVAGSDAETVIAALIDRADAAMYAAKRRGGNQTQHHRARCDSRESIRRQLGNATDEDTEH
jgi:PleD family two-component response regulator